MSSLLNSTNHQIAIPNIVKAAGVYVYDGDGNQYLDLESGVWCTSLGHNDPRINRVMAQMSERIIHAGFCYTSEIVEKAAESVLAITGFENGKCVFLCSGSEAIEFCRQAAQHITGRKLSMTLHDSYLGSYSSVKDRSRDWYLFDWQECAHCPHKENCQANCPRLQEIPEGISEFVFEPGSSSGFVRFPPEALIENITRRVRAQGGKIIANEVTTGIGRTGKWFGYNHYSIEPDMVAMGKGIGNGYPVSVAAFNAENARAVEQSTFRYMQSHQNDPLGAAIVKEVLEILTKERIIEHAAEKGFRFLEMLGSLRDGRTITEVRGRGLMFGVDLVDEQAGQRIFKELLQRGYIVCNRGSLLRIDPALTIGEGEFAVFIEQFKEALAQNS